MNRVGKRMKVSFEGVVDSESERHITFEVGESYFKPTLAKGYLTMEEALPEQWPPVFGDIWVDKDGDAWTGMDDGNMRMAVSTGSKMTQTDEVWRHYGPLRLIHSGALRRLR